MLASGHCLRKESSSQSLSASSPTSACAARIQPSWRATGAPQTFVSSADAAAAKATSARRSMSDLVIQAELTSWATVGKAVLAFADEALFGTAQHVRRQGRDCSPREG